MSPYRKCDVLLVEDDPYDLDLTVRAIRRSHKAAKIHTVRDGEEASAYLLDHHEAELPKVVFLDLKLPKMDGIDVLRRVRAAERTRSLPVVVLTSSDQQSDIDLCYELGANSYVIKPVESSRFAAAVAELDRYWLSLNEPPNSM